MGDTGVPRNQALISFANCFQVKSSYKLSGRIPSPSHHYSDNAMLKLANISGLAAVLDISSAVILFYGTEDQKSAYADFKQLRKTAINPCS